jgi:hypothetical protein
MELLGADAGGASPRLRRERGLHFVPEERLGRGAVPTLSLAQNLLLTRREYLRAGTWIAPGALATQARAIIERFRVKAGGPQAAARSLSGGNLQKFIMGREIDANPKVLIVAQPTWGVDVGAAAQIRAALLGLRDAGHGERARRRRLVARGRAAFRRGRCRRRGVCGSAAQAGDQRKARRETGPQPGAQTGSQRGESRWKHGERAYAARIAGDVGIGVWRNRGVVLLYLSSKTSADA